MEDKLLPCPFCESEHVLCTKTDYLASLVYGLQMYRPMENRTQGCNRSMEQPGRKVGGRRMKPEIIKLIEENPDLPVVPMVDSEVVADDYGYWQGKWGKCEVTEYYNGRAYIHFRDDDEEDVLKDMRECKYGHDKDGRDIYDLSDDEWKKLYDSIPWTKCIAVYITV